MEKYLYVILPNNCEQDVKNAFDKYFSHPEISTLLDLLYKVLSFTITKTSIQKIEMCVDKIAPNGVYKDGRITFNEQLIKRAKNISILPDVLDCAFHELSHAVMQINNIIILTDKININKFMPVYDLDKILNILEYMTGDANFARGGALYYYYKNKNEQNARKFACYLTNKMLTYFASDKEYLFNTFEDNEKKLMDELLDRYSFLRYGNSYVKSVITKYQKEMISKGIVNLSEEEMLNFVASINVVIEKNTQKLLVEGCAKCGDIDKVNMLLGTPLILLDFDEKLILSEHYDEDILNDMLFYKKDYIKHYDDYANIKIS